jgi:hypothetical protein
MAFLVEWCSFLLNEQINKYTASHIPHSFIIHIYLIQYNTVIYQINATKITNWGKRNEKILAEIYYARK